MYKMMRNWLLLLLWVCAVGPIFAQGGVKGGRKGQMMLNQTELVSFTNETVTGNFVRGNDSWSAFDRFMNKTKADIPTGVCFKEVPTASLVKSKTGEIPIGNGSDPSLSRVQVCCEGYERNVHNFRKCEPVCEQPCINSLCAGPNTCKCYPDHVKNYLDQCVPSCPIGCDNGKCDLDLRICVCNEGFELDETHQFCMPTCAGGCGAGRCVATNHCVCFPGYEHNLEGKCVPRCEKGCANGDCVAPGECKCHDGYEMTDEGCEPICPNGCFHGTCTAPNQCTCKPGYKMDPLGYTCEPSCDHRCLNGECTGPNTCTCHRGYTLDETNPLRCLPHCPNGCPNGVCSGPNMCLCNAGYIKDRSLKGSQACVKRV